MKFGAQLESYAIPEWQDKYIRYNALKKQLSHKYSEATSTFAFPFGQRRASTGTSLTGDSITTQQETIETINKEFVKLLDEELVKVEQHFTFEISFLIDRLTGVEEELTVLGDEEKEDRAIREVDDETEIDTSLDQNNFASESRRLSSVNSVEGSEQGGVRELATLIDNKKQKETERRAERIRRQLKQDFINRAKQRSSHRARLSRAVVGIWDCLEKLEGYVQLNVVALYKILKKRDKILGLKKLNFDLPTKKRRLSLLLVPQSVKDALVRLYNSTSSEKYPDTTLDIQSLSMLVQKQFVNSTDVVNSFWVPFFLGVCFTVCFDIVVIAYIPSAVSFSYSTILTLFPVFRVPLMVALISWGAAGVLAAFETYGVNYRFILDIDPKCSVSSHTLFALAGLLTSSWVVCFGAFIVDSKFGLLVPVSKLWIYPISVIVCHLIIFLLPSTTFRYCYRRQLLSVAFLSLYNGLYFLADYTEFNGFGMVDTISVPIVTLLPYWIRLSQCYSRYRSEQHDMKLIHGANMGKYFSVILVILSSNIEWENFVSIYVARLIFVSAYIIASLYGLVWDIIMDWGLLPDPDNFVRPDHRIMYPQWLYYFITLFNVVGRLTWALTLVPIGFLSDYRFNASMITLSISSLEILRRSAWLVLRLENEHLTNSSRYRAMLWVPKMTLAHPEVNPYIDSGSTALHQALKRFATVQVGILSKPQSIDENIGDTILHMGRRSVSEKNITALHQPEFTKSSY